MTATLLYRVAAVIFILFAAGHTFEFLKFNPPNADGAAVFEGMKHVRLAVGDGKHTYNDFYRGFGLFCTAYLLFSAYVAWYLGGLAKSSPQAVGTLGWAFFLLQLASLALSWIYFLPPPAILSAVIAICTGWAAWLVKGA
jgi:hypothetical protein